MLSVHNKSPETSSVEATEAASLHPNISHTGRGETEPLWVGRLNFDSACKTEKAVKWRSQRYHSVKCVKS